MPNTKHAFPWSSVTLISIGLLLTVGWAIIVAIYDLSTALPCHFNPNNCSEGDAMRDIIIRTPFILGSFLLAFATFYRVQINLYYKVFTIITSTVMIYFAIFFMAAYLIILLD